MVVAGEMEHGSKEIELKLEFDPADMARIKGHPALMAAEPEERALISIYYDTDDSTLRRAGVYLRVRDTGTGYVQTIKTVKSDAELLERYEWEQEVPSRVPDLVAAEGTALAPLLTDEVRGSLRPIFLTRIRRTTYRLAQNESEIEVAIDQGEIVSSAHDCAVSEVELELKRGETASLFHLARTLAETLPLRLAVKTKAERGFALVAGEEATVEKAGSLDIPPSMPSEEAFRVIARSCLRQIIANEPGMCAGDAEALHQMRIGLRRLRAAILLFADIIADEARERITDELQWITQELGPARDLDVFAIEVLQNLPEAYPEDSDVATAHRQFGEQRAMAYARATIQVRSDRFRHAVLDLAEWVEIGPWTRADDADRLALRKQPIAEHARKELRRLRKRIRNKGAELRALDVSQLHRLRIRVKRLRYATEFFAETFPGAKRTRRRTKILAALKDLQDALGGLNDLAIRQSLVAGDVEDEVIDHRLGVPEADGKKLLAKAKDAYARFVRTKPFWKA